VHHQERLLLSRACRAGAEAKAAHGAGAARKPAPPPPKKMGIASDVSADPLRAAAEADLLATDAPQQGACGASPTAATCAGAAAAAAPSDEQQPPPLLSPWTLRFTQPEVERAFQHEWDTMRATTHDKQGAGVYFAMVCGAVQLLGELQG